MDDKQKLIAWLTNLKAQGKSTATIDIDLILKYLNEKSNSDIIKPKSDVRNVYIDGGGF